MRLGFSLILVLFGLWLLWSGHYDALMVSLGVGSCLFVLLLSIRLKVVDPEGVPVHITQRLFVYYIPWLVIEIIKANLDVARLILTPRLNISPTIIEVEAFQKSDLGQMIYANSITLTPGTVAIDVRDGKVLVHAITQEAAQALIDGDMDKRAAFLEGKKTPRKGTS